MRETGFALGDLLERAPDPDPDLAATDAQRLIAFLFVSPRPCEVVERLVERGAWSPARELCAAD